MEAFKSLDGMEWTSIMTTMTKARTINSPYKLLQNQKTNPTGHRIKHRKPNDFSLKVMFH